MNSTLRDIMKNAPNPVIYMCASMVFVTVVAAFVIFGVTGGDATEFRAFLNVVMNGAILLLSGGSLVVAGAAAKSAGKAEEQTNGALDTRIQKAVTQALDIQERKTTDGRSAL